MVEPYQNIRTENEQTPLKINTSRAHEKSAVADCQGNPNQQDNEIPLFQTRENGIYQKIQITVFLA